MDYEKKIDRVINKILVTSILIGIISITTNNFINSFYLWIVVGLTGTGLIVSTVLKILIKRHSSVLEKVYDFVDTISVVWVFFLVFYFIATFVVYPARVNGSSMEDNYHDRDIVLFYQHGAIERFDVVFINATSERYFINADEYLLKRIIGLPGDYIEYQDSKLYVNGEFTEESFINHSTYDFKLDEMCFVKNQEDICNTDGAIIIPKDYYFVLGDNRTNSIDSRVIGLVYVDDIYGKSILNLMKR